MNDNTDRSIAVDFDGTVVEFAYPAIGKPVPGAIESLRFLQEKGIRLILWTCRTGKHLDEAVEYMAYHAGIALHGVNGRPEEPGWPNGPKIFATCYVDDAACGCPHRPASEGFRPVVDWRQVMFHLEDVFPGEGIFAFATTLP